MTVLLTGCVTTKTIVEYKYVKPDIPQHLLESCENVPVSITTNGELVTAYITLQTDYLVCSSKVTSIATILKSYNDNYSNQDNKEEK